MNQNEKLELIKQRMAILLAGNAMVIHSPTHPNENSEKKETTILSPQAEWIMDRVEKILQDQMIRKWWIEIITSDEGL